MAGKQIFRLLMISAALSPLGGFPAAAQMYPGEDVIVNPAAIPPPYSRSGFSDQKIVLKRPGRHRRHAATAAAPAPQAEAATASTDVSAPPAATESKPRPAKPKRQKHTAEVTQAPQAPTASGGAVPFTLNGEDEPLGAPQTKVAKAEPPPQETQKPGKSDASVPGGPAHIIFEHGATEPQPSQREGIKMLATDLNTALEGGTTQIELQAFGGAPGDKSSEARRISFKRALAIRQLLIDNGVPASRIITRAMGGATDSGSPDRVDIYLRAS